MGKKHKRNRNIKTCGSCSKTARINRKHTHEKKLNSRRRRKSVKTELRFELDELKGRKCSTFKFSKKVHPEEIYHYQWGLGKYSRRRDQRIFDKDKELLKFYHISYQV